MRLFNWHDVSPTYWIPQFLHDCRYIKLEVLHVITSSLRTMYVLPVTVDLNTFSAQCIIQHVRQPFAPHGCILFVLVEGTVDVSGVAIIVGEVIIVPVFATSAGVSRFVWDLVFMVVFVVFP